MVNFVLDALDSSLNMGVSGEVLSEEAPTLDVSATAVYYVDLSNLRQVFQFQTDSSDVDFVEDATDVKYFVKMGNWDPSAVINPAHAMMDATESETPVASGFDPDRSLVKHDFVRYLAQQLFNTHKGVDLFDNENALKDDLAEKGHDAWLNDISGALWYTSEEGESDENTLNGEGFLTNDASGNDNLTRQLLLQMTHYAVERLVDQSGNLDINDTLEPQPIPFHIDDTISFKFTIHPADNQHQLTQREQAVVPRPYEIKLVVKDTENAVNTTPLDYQTGDNTNSVVSTYNNSYVSYTQS